MFRLPYWIQSSSCLILRIGLIEILNRICDVCDKAYQLLEVKMAAGLTHDVLRAEMLAIVSAFDMVNARQVREMLRLRWDEISAHLENGTMLFIMGIHGNEDGKLGERENNIRTMQNQVTNPIIINQKTYMLLIILNA